MFFTKKTIVNSKKRSMFGFSISCTTQTVFKVRYTNGQLCNCGEYSVKERVLTKTCDANLILLNFTVEISVKSIRNQWGENCSFSFLFPGDGDIRSDLRILPGNISTTLQPSLTTSEILPTSTTMVEIPEGTFDTCTFDTFRYSNRT